MCKFKATVVNPQTNEKIRFEMESVDGIRDAIFKALGIDIRDLGEGKEYFAIRFRRGWDVGYYDDNTRRMERICYVYLKAVEGKPYTVTQVEGVA